MFEANTITIEVECFVFYIRIEAQAGSQYISLNEGANII